MARGSHRDREWPLLPVIDRAIAKPDFQRLLYSQQIRAFGNARSRYTINGSGCNKWHRCVSGS
jgi:hypothetical protein